MNRQIHDSIKPTKKEIDKVKFTTSSKPSVQELKFNQALAFPTNFPKVASGIDKDSIISSYTNSCEKLGVSKQVSTTKKGEALHHPPHHQLILNCTMRPSLDLQYRVWDLSIENVLVLLSSVMKRTYQVKTSVVSSKSMSCLKKWFRMSSNYGRLISRL